MTMGTVVSESFAGGSYGFSKMLLIINFLFILIILQPSTVSPTFLKSIATTFCVYLLTTIAFQSSESHHL